MEKDEKNLQLKIDFIKHLSLCLRNTKSYPSGHPYISKTLTEATDLLREVMSGKPELPLAFFENNLFVEESRIDREVAPAVSGLVNTAIRLDLRSISFKKGVTSEELQNLFNLLSLDRLSLEKGGGMYKILEEMKLTHIGFNEIEFGIISKRGEMKKGTVSVSWEVFQKMLNLPENLSATLKENPEEIADLMFQTPLSNLGDFSEDETKKDSEEWKGLSELDRAVKNVENFVLALKNQSTEGTPYLKGLSEFITHVKPTLEKRVKDREAFDSKVGEVLEKSLEETPDPEIVKAALIQYQVLRKEGHSEKDSYSAIQNFLTTLPMSQARMERILPLIENTLKEGISGESTPSSPLSWDLFDKMLKIPDQLIETLKKNPEGVAEMMFQNPMPNLKEGVEWKNLSNLDRAMTNVEGMVQTLFNQYSDTDKSRYIKGITELIVLLKPIMAGKVDDQDSFNSRVANVFRNALHRVPDKDLVDAVMSRFQEIRQEGKSDDDALALVKKFVSTIAVDPDRRERLYPSIKSGLAQEMEKPVTPAASPESSQGSGLPKDVSIIEAERTRGGSSVLLGKESYEKMKIQVKEGLVAEDVDQLLTPFLKALDDSSPERRKWGSESIGNLLVSLLEKEKFQATEKLVKMLKERLDQEESFEVYLTHVSTMERVASVMRGKGRLDVAEEIQKIFSEQISSESKRKRAIQALGKVGGTDALISLLSALWESGIYKEVRDAIVQMGKEAMPLIMEIFLEAEDKTLRRRVHDLLVHVGKNAIEPLRGIFQDERWYVRRDCASILGGIGDPSSLTSLVTLLRDSNDLVRMEALNGIGKIGGEEAERILFDNLKEGSIQMKTEAIRILGKIGGRFAAQNLSNTLLQESNERFQKEICRTLGQLGKEEAVETLLKVMEGSSISGRLKYSDDLRVNAIFALSKIGGKTAQERIQKLTSDKSRQIQLAAQSALRRMEEIRK